MLRRPRYAKRLYLPDLKPHNFANLPLHKAGADGAYFVVHDTKVIPTPAPSPQPRA